MDRKLRSTSDMKQRKGTTSTNKLYHKQSHILLKKPNKISKQKENLHNQSTTVLSHNISKSSFQAKKREKNCEVAEKRIIRQIVGLEKKMREQLKIVKQNKEKRIEKEKIWEDSIKGFLTKISTPQVKLLVQTLQKGYQTILKVEANGKTSTNHTFHLKIGAINKQNILDYQDEFMSKIDQFSPSWRQRLNQQRRTSNF